MPKQKYWDGTAWQEIGASANKVTITDSGSIISATNVETALQEIVKNPSNVQKVPTATGTGTAIILATDKGSFLLSDGYSVTFKASANNSGSATTINIDGKGAKNIYKPGTTTAPTLISDKYYTIVYSSTSSCFFIKASATGTATSAQVLAGVPFSNENDTDLVGTMTNRGAVSQSLAVNGSYTIPAGYHNGSGEVTQSITTKAAATYTPSTSNQTIAAGQYLSGTQTIVGDADLVSANIKAGKNIFGVAGDLNVVDTSGDTVTSGSQMLSGYKAHSKGTQYTGTIPSKSAATYTPSQSTQTIASGQYLSGNQTINPVSFDETKVLSGTTIAGKAGTMPDRAGDTAASAITRSGTTIKLKATEGYRDGTNDYVTHADANDVAANIKEDVVIRGLTGTCKPAVTSFTAGTNYIIAQLLNKITVYSTTGQKVVEYTFNIGGTVRVSFGLCSEYSVPDGNVWAQIHKNGSAVGTLRYNDEDSPITYTEDISISSGDKLQLYSGTIESGDMAQITNFKIQTVQQPLSYMSALSDQYVDIYTL